MKIHFFEEVDSTNNVIKKMAEEGADDCTAVVAEVQTAGRGRMGREWNSPKSSGIWMSFLLRPDVRPESASMLTIVTAMAARSAIFKVTGAEAMIKWPNDLVLNGRKVCGILTEMKAQIGCVDYVVVGIGINVNTAEFPKELQDTATSLYLELGCEFERRQIIEEFDRAFAGYYEQFLKTEDLSLLKDEYNGYLANMNNRVKILDADGGYTGISTGINDAGELLVRNEEGKLCTVRSGEVSVRGIYGYV